MEKLDEGWESVVEGLDRGVEREGMASRWTEEERKRREEKKPGHADFRERYYEGFGSTKKGLQEEVERLKLGQDMEKVEGGASEGK